MISEIFKFWFMLTLCSIIFLTYISLFWNIGISWFIVLHRYCLFYELKTRPSTSKKEYDLLYCNSWFTVVVWNRPIISLTSSCTVIVLIYFIGLLIWYALAVHGNFILLHILFCFVFLSVILCGNWSPYILLVNFIYN